MIELERISQHQAAQALAGMAEFDPSGLISEQDLAQLCEGCECVRITAGGSSAVLVLRDCGPVLWVEALKGAGLATASDAAEHIARTNGKGAVSFQTARPGLVRAMQRRGYRVAGWIMTKDIQQ